MKRSWRITRHTVTYLRQLQKLFPPLLIGFNLSQVPRLFSKSLAPPDSRLQCYYSCIQKILLLKKFPAIKQQIPVRSYRLQPLTGLLDNAIQTYLKYLLIIRPAGPAAVQP